MEELLKILNEVKPGVDYENETDLIVVLYQTRRDIRQ